MDTLNFILGSSNKFALYPDSRQNNFCHFFQNLQKIWPKFIFLGKNRNIAFIFPINLEKFFDIMLFNEFFGFRQINFLKNVKKIKICKKNKKINLFFIVHSNQNCFNFWIQHCCFNIFKAFRQFFEGFRFFSIKNQHEKVSWFIIN